MMRLLLKGGSLDHDTCVHCKCHKERGDLLPEKAREILHDGTVHGHPITEQQRKYFGAVASGSAMQKARAIPKTPPTYLLHKAHGLGPLSSCLYCASLFKADVKEPGSRGGHGYFDEHGQWQYGERPTSRSATSSHMDMQEELYWNNITAKPGRWELMNVRGDAAKDLVAGIPVTVRDEQNKRTVRGRLAIEGEGWNRRAWIADATHEPDPLPPVVNGKITLPDRLGHAHTRSWRTGDIVEIHGQHYRVTGKPKAAGAGVTYALTPANEKQMATRPGRVKLDVPTDHVTHQVGRVVKVGDEWLAIEETSRQSYGSAEGEHFGYNHYGKGHFVPASKAAKMNAAWEKKDRVRSLELSLRVERSGDMSTPERVRQLEGELAEAKRAAGIGS